MEPAWRRAPRAGEMGLSPLLQCSWLASALPCLQSATHVGWAAPSLPKTVTLYLSLEARSALWAQGPGGGRWVAHPLDSVPRASLSVAWPLVQRVELCEQCFPVRGHVAVGKPLQDIVLFPGPLSQLGAGSEWHRGIVQLGCAPGAD